AELVLGVGELAGVLHQEAGLADELTRGTGTDLGGLALVLGVDRLVLLLVLVLVDDGDAVLEDGVEIGLDVVGVGLLVVLVIVVGLDDRDDDLFLVLFDQVDVVTLEVLDEQVLVVLEVVFVEVLFSLDFLFEVFFNVVGHHTSLQGENRGAGATAAGL